MTPQTIYVNQHKLPKMIDTDEVDSLLRQFEISLRTARKNLLSQLTLRAKEQIIHLLERDDNDYEEIKEALLSRHITTYASVADTFITGNKGEIYNIDVQQGG